MPRKVIDIDFKPLAKFASSRKILLKEALNSDKFAQVGINLFRDRQSDSIWKVEKGEDGQEYIVRGDPTEQHAVQSWTANVDSQKNVILSYRKTPICKFASSELGFEDAEDLNLFCKYLLERVREAAFIRDLCTRFAEARNALK